MNDMRIILLDNYNMNKERGANGGVYKKEEAV